MVRFFSLSLFSLLSAGKCLIGIIVCRRIQNNGAQFSFSLHTQGHRPYELDGVILRRHAFGRQNWFTDRKFRR